MAEDLKENITFRFSKTVIDRMRFEADHQNVSLNTIAQRVVSEYYDWHAHAARAGMIPIHKSVLAQMLDKLSEGEVKQIAEFFVEIRINEVLLIFRQNTDLPSFLDMFESWLKVSSMQYSKDLKGNTYSYVIQHELGNKWSVFLSSMLSSVSEKLGARPNFQVTENTIMFNISLQSAKPPSMKS